MKRLKSKSIGINLLAAGILVLAVTVQSAAQGNSVIARYGIGTSQNASMISSEWAWNLTTDSEFFGMGREVQSFGSFSAELKVVVSARLKASVLVARTPFIIRSNGNQSDVEMITVAGGFQFMYIETGSFRLYSQVLVGYTTVDIRGNAVTPFSTGFVNGHCSLIGIELGERIFFTSELGYGIKGVLNMGAGIKF